MAIDTVRKNLGPVSAYAYAKTKGYTGTEEEFAELMASYANVAEQAGDSAEAAAASAALADQHATTAANAAVQARTEAGTAATQAGIAANQATSAASSAQAAATEADRAAAKAGEAAQSASDLADAVAAANTAKTAAQTAQGLAEDAKTAAETARTGAQTAKTGAETAQAAAEAAQAAAEAVEESIPADYSTLSNDVTDLKSALDENVADLKQELLPLFKDSIIIYNGQPKVTNWLISGVTNTYTFTDYIDCDLSSGDTVFYKMLMDYSSQAVYSEIKILFAFYNSSKSNIETHYVTIPKNETQSGTVPVAHDGIKYMKLALFLNYASGTSVTPYTEDFYFTELAVSNGEIKIDNSFYTLSEKAEYVSTYHQIDNTNYSTYLPTKKLSDLPKNSIAYVSATGISDAPDGDHSYVVKTFTGYAGYQYAVYQDAYDVNTAILYYRYSANGSSFSAWTALISNPVKYTKTYGNISASNYITMLPTKKAGDLPVNTITYVAADLTLEDVPETGNSIIFTYTGYSGYEYAKYQEIFMVVTGYKYHRYSANGINWTDWKICSPVPDTYALETFESLSCIGDSYTKGSLYGASSHIGYVTYQRYANILSRKNDISTLNVYATGGVSTKGWIAYHLAEMLADEPTQLYTIFLGINDAYSEYTIGSATDINVGEGYDSNADNFYGQYSRIIANIMHHSPSALILLIKIPKAVPYGLSVKDYYNEAIQTIGDTLQIPVIDIDKTVAGERFNSSVILGGHPTIEGQAILASAINEGINRAVQQYPTYFNTFTGDADPNA